jgi:hypothetical protein
MACSMPGAAPRPGYECRTDRAWAGDERLTDVNAIRRATTVVVARFMEVSLREGREGKKFWPKMP